MRRPSFIRTISLAALAAGALVPACKDDHSHDVDEGDRSHGGASGHAPHGDELPGQSVTIWARRTELFMEHPPLIVGQETAFAAHVTAMPSFKAVTQGAVTLTVRIADGSVVGGRVQAPTSPGIFRPAVTPKSAGPCEMSMAVAGPQLEEKFVVGPCVVHPDAAAARAALGDEEEAAGRIVYLKEQQWKTDFAVAPAEERELQAGVRASGELKAVTGREARLTAAVAGRVTLPASPPVLGMPVKKGQVLAAIVARLTNGTDRASLDADVEAARAEVAAAEAQLARSERLFADQAVPAKTVEEARTRLTVARARLSGGTGRLQQYSAGATGAGAAGRGAFQVRSPLDGTLVAVDVTAGQVVEEGQPLFHVIDLGRLWLVAQVFEPDIPKVEGARAAWFSVEGYAVPFTVDETNGRLVTVGRVLDPKTRTVPVIFELQNPEGRLRVGQFARVSIATGAPTKALAIPEAAVVEDAGKATTYVMVEGEAFERRPLTLGIRSNGWVEVKDGVKAGERVVTKGAYEIKLASASGAIPAHGHAH